MPQEFKNDQIKHMEQKHKQLYVALTTLVVLSVVAYFGVDYATKSISIPEEHFATSTPTVAADVTKLAPASTQKGIIQLSLVPKNFNALPISFTYTPKRISPDELAFTVKKNSGFFPTHLSRSANGLWSTFIAIVPPSKGGDESSLMLYRAPYSVDDPLADVIHEGQMIKNFAGQDKILSPRLPQINNKGLVLYMALHDKEKQESIGELNLSDWDIRLNNGKADTIVATGLYPHWISNDEFIYTSKDGEHRYSVASKTDTLAFKLAREDGRSINIQANMMSAISEDGKIFAFSNPEESGVYIYSVDGVKVEPPHFIKGAWGFWPLISPDGKTLAIQSVNSATGKDKEPYIAFFDIATGAPLPEGVSLVGYNPDALFMTDWK